MTKNVIAAIVGSVCAMFLWEAQSFAQEAISGTSLNITGPASISGSTSLDSLTVSGTADFMGNSLSLGSWLSDSGMPGVTFTYTDATSTPTPSLLKLTATRPSHEWLWEHNTADQTSTIPMMKLDANHVLTIYDTAGNAAIVLNPAGSSDATTVLTQQAADSRYVSSAYITAGTDTWGWGSPTIALPGGTATGPYSFAGINATASGEYSIASGAFSTASGFSATASGNTSISSGWYSTVNGCFSIASGDRSNAMANWSTASGYQSTASGIGATASGESSTASGGWSTASGVYSVASGVYSSASGVASVASGYGSNASGDSSIASGYQSTTSAVGSIASGDHSIAAGWDAIASGQYSIASGFGSTASGYSSTATGQYATAVGYHTTAQAYASTIVGTFNIIQGNSFDLGPYGGIGYWYGTDDLFVVGNGTRQYDAFGNLMYDEYGNLLTDVDSNALVVKKNGDTTVYGKFTVSGSNGSTAATPSGFSIAYVDGTNGVNSSITLQSTRPSSVWNWQRLTASGTSSKNVMQLDASNRLILTGTADTNPPQLVLDPNGAISLGGSNLLTQAAANSLYLSATAGLVASNGNIGIGGTASSTAALQILKSGAQLRLANVSNKPADFAVDGSGNLTITSASDAQTTVNGRFNIYKNGYANPTDGYFNLGASDGSVGILADFFVEGNWSNALVAQVGNGAAGICNDAIVMRRTYDYGVFQSAGLGSGIGMLFQIWNTQGIPKDTGRISSLLSGTGISLNADMGFSTTSSNSITEKMRITASGNVGIGTASPSTKLHVYTTTSGDSFKIENLQSTIGGSLTMNVDPQGRTSVNVASAKGSSTTAGAYFNATGYEEAWFMVHANKNTAGYRAMRFGNSTNGVFDTTNGTFAIQRLSDNWGSVSATPFQISNAAPTNSFILNSTGNVGIGTMTPQAKLDVVGSANVSGTLAISGSGALKLPDGTVLTGSNTLKSVLANGTISNLTLSGTTKILGGLDVGSASVNGSSLITQTDADARYFSATAGLTATNGNIGIGTSNPGSYKLAIQGGVLISSPSAWAPGQVAALRFGDGAHGLLVPYSTAASWNNYNGINFTNNTGTALSVGASSGVGGNLNVGVGGILAHAANARLQVRGATADSTSVALNITNSSDGSLLYVRNDGNLGVGTTTPQAKLDVVGNAKISGNLALSGTTTVTGGLVISGTAVASGTATKIVASGSNQLVLIPEQGDLSMGDFTHGSQPPQQ